jgi:GDPmannose 4,6-dehydratase
MKAALITGVTGQDGSYLAEFLLEKSYSVYGMARYCSEPKHERLGNVRKHPEFNLVEGDLTDASRISTILNSIAEIYDVIEVYNLGAQSHVKLSFDQPEYTANVDALGTLRVLEAIRNSKYKTKFKFYQAGTSEMFGKVQQTPQNEETPFYPRSPYGVSKVFAYWITRNYREAYGIYACTGILFNHESERRGPEFVTRKITLGLNKWIKTQTPIELGNLEAQRDWGHALDYVNAMWLMLQQQEPEDFVIGTGQTHSIKTFIVTALNLLGVVHHWEGSGIDEKCIHTPTGLVIVQVNPEFYRPAEVDVLIANPTKAYEKLNWRPTISFQELVFKMLKNDITPPN